MAEAVPTDKLLRAVRDRETLWRIPATGMEICRAMKHEPIDFDSLDRDELASHTDDRNGSKFLSRWTLRRLVLWSVEQSEVIDPRTGRPWRFPPGAKSRVKVRLAEPVGYVRGELVHTITMVARGRYIHAYPDED